jgi:polyisoprenoid-binding protein YceI
MTSIRDFETLPAAAAAVGDDLTGDYQIDVTHTRLGFVARHAMVTSVRGFFGDFDGTIHLDATEPAKSTAKLTIAVASVATGQQKRDDHLRSADFFDVEKYPKMTFVSTEAEQLDEETYRLTGDLTIKEVTRPVTIEFTFNGSAKDPFGNLRIGFDGKTAVNRKDWGLTWNAALETGGVLVSDKIKLEFDVSAVKINSEG